MKVLVHTRFAPSVGGIESVATLLANEWVKAGESVTVVTDVAAGPVQTVDSPSVVRRPGFSEWIRLLRATDVFVHFNISLRALWPLMFVHRPFVAVHHGFYVVDRTGRRDWREKLKLRVAGRATKNIAASHAIAKELGRDCIVIPNPYDRFTFNVIGPRVRDRDLIFVGRLVSDKGGATLLNALEILARRGLRPGATVVGDGPERLPLEELAARLGIVQQVVFTGPKTQSEIANVLRNHKLLIVPSLWKEPFGVVALEGIACGCAVIGSNTGGLPEAIGSCGLTFPNGDSVALADRIQELLTSEAKVTELLSHADEHLQRHNSAPIAKRYLEVMREAICRN